MPKSFFKNSGKLCSVTDRSAAFRKRVAQDVTNAAFWHKREADRRVAEHFIGQSQETVQRATDFPSLGSPRLARVLSSLDVRCLPLDGFPYLVFYVETAGGIEVIRVLHSARDIPTHSQESPSNSPRN